MLKQSFNPSRGIGLLLAVGLALLALPGAGNAMAIKSASAQSQDQKRVAAQSKFDEGESLSWRGTEESLRSALKKYEEALALWQAISGYEALR
jgi:hypothetical protein